METLMIILDMPSLGRLCAGFHCRLPRRSTSFIIRRIWDALERSYRFSTLCLGGTNSTASLKGSKRRNNDLVDTVVWYARSKILPTFLSNKYHTPFTRHHPMCINNENSAELVILLVLVNKFKFPQTSYSLHLH
mmetsp:Transcript_24178/g.46298  ORF Transcript_24178/g.46298 Transcript_24178/m.46298 type:complete len:134 (+) Transcript_24178:840-1241(+)